MVPRLLLLCLRELLQQLLILVVQLLLPHPLPLLSLLPLQLLLLHSSRCLMVR